MAGALVLASPTPGVAQEPEEDEAPPAAAAEAAESRPAVPAVLLENLRRYAQGPPPRLALALREGARLRLWEEVGEFLDQTAARNLPAEVQAEMARVIGSPLLLRMRTQPLLAEPQRRVAAQLQEALQEAAEEPEALREAITQLGTAQEAPALRRLLGGGSAAIAEVAAAVAQPEPPAPRSQLIHLLGRMGPEAVDAVRQLFLYGEAPLRSGALEALAALEPGDAALPDLLAARDALGATEAERRVASAAIQRRLSREPGPDEVVAYLHEHLRGANAALARAVRDDLGEEIWRIDEDRRGVVRLRTTRQAAAARRAADAAERLRRLAVLEGPPLREAILADVRYQVIVDPDFGSDDQLQAVRQAWGEAFDEPAQLSGLLDAALAGGDLGAAIVLLRLMAATEDAALVDTGGPSVASLVRAVSHSEPRVRYEAALAVAQLGAQRPYAGSSTLPDRWIEMAQLEEQPRALVLESFGPRVRELTRWISDLGYRADVVATARDLERAIDAGGDLQVIVATVQPRDVGAVELIDRIRRRPLGGTVPILLMAPGTEWFAARQWLEGELEQTAPGVVDLRHVGSPVGLVQALRGIEAARPLPPLSAAERQVYAVSAWAVLARLGDPAGPGDLYDFRSRAGDLIGALQRSGYRGESLAVISGLGTPDSQELLAALAGSANVALDQRRQAAEAFARSVERFGTRLSRQQVVRQYDRLNELRDAEEREPLQRVVEAMQQRVGITARPR